MRNIEPGIVNQQLLSLFAKHIFQEKRGGIRTGRLLGDTCGGEDEHGSLGRKDNVHRVSFGLDPHGVVIVPSTRIALSPAATTLTPWEAAWTMTGLLLRRLR